MKDEHLFRFQKLRHFIASLASLRSACIRSHSRSETARSSTRASKSCFLCLCEDFPNEGAAMRHKYSSESRNSLAETVGAWISPPPSASWRQEDAALSRSSV